MSDIALDVNGDIDLTNLQLNLLSDALAVAQEIKIAVRFVLAEWPLDTRVGINFFGRPGFTDDTTRLLGRKGITPDEVSTEYRRALLSIPGVTQVLSISTVIGSDRIGTITWRAMTDVAGIVEGQEALVIHS